jgi:hypothetical protein
VSLLLKFRKPDFATLSPMLFDERPLACQIKEKALLPKR